MKPTLDVWVEYAVFVCEIAGLEHKRCRVERVFEALFKRQKYDRHGVEARSCRGLAVSGDAGVWRQQVAIMPLTGAEAGDKRLFRSGVASKNADILDRKPCAYAQSLGLELLQKRRIAAFVECGQLRVEIKHRTAHAFKRRAAAFVIVLEIRKVTL